MVVAAPVMPVAAAPSGGTRIAAYEPASGPAEAGTADYAPASVLGLDAEETAPATRLTKALRRAFAARGLGGGEEANLSELRLALGCRADTPECLAGGGSMLRTRRLIYGSLHKFESGLWALDISILEVESATLAAHDTFKFQGEDLAPARIDRLAEEFVSRLLTDEILATVPEASVGGPPPPPEVNGDSPFEPEPSAEPEPSSEPGPSSEPSRGDRLVWGYQRPTPRWKWAGFGVSAGLGLIGVVGAATTAAWINADGDARWGFRPSLLDAAHDSLNNPNAFNRVDPAMPGDLCEYNRRDDNGELLMAADGGPGARDVGVGDVCNRGADMYTNFIAFSITAGIGLVSTTVFTILLFVHREPKGRVARAWRRRGLQLGSSPFATGGAGLQLGGRF